MGTINESDIEAEAKLLLRCADESGFVITPDNRISLKDAARLVGYRAASFRNLIREGRGPRTFHVGIGSSRKSIRIYDLARWLISNVDERH